MCSNINGKKIKEVVEFAPKIYGRTSFVLWFLDVLLVIKYGSFPLFRIYYYAIFNNSKVCVKSWLLKLLEVLTRCYEKKRPWQTMTIEEFQRIQNSMKWIFVKERHEISTFLHSPCNLRANRRMIMPGRISKISQKINLSDARVWGLAKEFSLLQRL